jgi:hypothetical protein
VAVAGQTEEFSGRWLACSSESLLMARACRTLPSQADVGTESERESQRAQRGIGRLWRARPGVTRVGHPMGGGDTGAIRTAGGARVKRQPGEQAETTTAAERGVVRRSRRGGAGVAEPAGRGSRG